MDAAALGGVVRILNHSQSGSQPLMTDAFLCKWNLAEHSVDSFDRTCLAAASKVTQTLATKGAKVRNAA